MRLRTRRRQRVTGTIRITLFVVAAAVSGYMVPHINDRFLPWMGTDLSRDQVLTFLASVATGMMAFMGIVFSLLLLLPQLGTAAYSPRVVNLWVRNRTIPNAAGVFAGTFLYSLMAIRGIEILQSSRSSALTLYVAFGWLIASIAMIVRLVRIFVGLTHTEVLYLLGSQASAAIEHMYPRSARTESTDELPTPVALSEYPSCPSQVVSHGGPPLYVLWLDVERLARIARGAQVTIRVPLAPGDSISQGTPLVLVYGANTVSERALRKWILLGRERAIEADPKYGLRVLVDVAIHALAPATNDPTTAVQALDQIESVLLQLGNADLQVGQVRDEGGQLRLVYDATTWEEYLELALSEIQFYGANSFQIERRLAALYASLRDNLPPLRRSAVDALARQRSMAIEQTFSGAPRVIAERGDRQGLGHSLH
jgi:uncharacterized membrane protein